MKSDKLFDISQNEIQQEIVLSRSKKNGVRPIHCWADWDDKTQAYVLTLDEDGIARFEKGKRYKLDNGVVLEPEKQYLFRMGQYIGLERVTQGSGHQLFLHYGEQRYLLLRRIHDTRDRKILLCVDTFAKNSLVILKMRCISEHDSFARFQRSTLFLESLNSQIIPQFKYAADMPLGNHKYHVQCFEYVKGQLLAETIPLIKDDAIQLFHRIALAIQELHQAGFTHRNLSPEHILITPDQQIKLIGLSVLSKKNKPRIKSEESISLTFSCVLNEPTEANAPLDVTMVGQIVGNCMYVPAIVADDKSKDACSVVFLFLYSILSILSGNNQRENFRRALSDVNALAQGLGQFVPDTLPTTLKSLIHDVVEKIRDKQTVEIREVVEGFAQASGFAHHGITRQDQYPMPKEAEISIPDVEIAIWYQPLEEVGGDFYDCIPLGKNKTGILIGDMMGHGLKACLYTQLIYPVARLFADQKMASTEILERIDGLLYNNKGTFATALYGTLSCNHRNPYFMYSSAGQPSPILYHKGKASYAALDNQVFLGRKLGLGPNYFECLENFIRLESGDVLIFYTDGITEMTNGGEEFYNYTKDNQGNFCDRFLKLVEALASSSLPMRDVVSMISKDLRSFSGGAAFEDDITLIALKIL